jgi:hypothetical protein
MDYMRNTGYTKIYGEETPGCTNIWWQNTGDTHQWCSKHQLRNPNQWWQNTSYVTLIHGGETPVILLNCAETPVMLINDRNLRLQHIMLVNGGGELQLWYGTSPSRSHYHLME